MIGLENIVKIHDWLWEIPKNYRSDMRVPARVYASEKMLSEIIQDRSLDQLINVATLPGIQKYALAMPDVHEGYGAPIGGVFATDIESGIISPGAIGYDINCGVRLLRSEKFAEEIRPHLEALGQTLYSEVPSGVGRGGRLDLKRKDLNSVLKNGARWMIENGYGQTQDLENLESGGVLEIADPELVSDKAKARGKDQLGTMGAGNHFVEVEFAEEILDETEAKKLNIQKGQVAVLIHMGSRGLGHQIATDYIRLMMKAMLKYGISLPDRELACAPFASKEGQSYFKAMSAGANFAWANRQMITWEVRKAWHDVLGESGGKLEVVYDIAHNLAKLERYDVDGQSRVRRGQSRELVVHRKGATRSFLGQPVLIPGSMGTASYLLIGQEKAMAESFGSSCHGAGRRMSRSEAKRKVSGRELKEQLKKQGIFVNAGSISGLAEEAPMAYKDVDEVVDLVHLAGLAKKVVRFKPLAVIKG